MTFNDEQKQAEFEAFAAYFATVSKRPFTAASRSLLNQLRTIGVGQYGNGAFQEVLRENRREVPPQAERPVKPSGGGNRRGQSLGTQKAPPPGSKRAERIEQRRLAQGGRSVAQEVVAGGDLKPIVNAPGATFDTETGSTENNLVQDAAVLSAKELAEKHGRDLMFDYLLNAGHDIEELEQKSDRQIANLLKKEAAKQ